MKRSILVTLVLCLLIVAAASLVEAEGDPFVITPYPPYTPPDTVYIVPAGQEVIIRAGWGACTRGLAHASIHASSISMEVTKDGEDWITVEPSSREYWNPVESSEIEGPNACVMHNSLSWWTEWFYSLGTLEAGTYEVHFVWAFSHQLVDGGDYDGDGHIDFVDSGVLQDVTTTIVVE